MAIPRLTDDPAARLLASCEERGLTVATAESLTGGALVSRLIDVPGASAVVEGGACTYSFEAKAAVLSLDLDDLRQHGAVRRSVAEHMAKGARARYGADLVLSTTGVAGPGADPYGVPEGSAFISCMLGTQLETRELSLSGGRAAIRAGVVEEALALALHVLGDTPQWREA